MIGPVLGANIVRDRETGGLKGYAFVHFETEEAMKSALSDQWRYSVQVKVRAVHCNAELH